MSSTLKRISALIAAGVVLLVLGMVLTIEPGIYLRDEALGVRIEDDVLLTENGSELLTGDLLREAEEIEALMGEAPRWIRPR